MKNTSEQVTPITESRSYIPYYILIIAVIVFVSNLLQKIGYSPDDTYIYLKYARNLVSGGGFSFNYGEPSYGVTSPIWSMILAIGSLFLSDAYWFAKFVDLLFTFLSAVMFFKLSLLVLRKTYDDEKLVRNLNLISVSVFLLNSWYIRWAFTGMETTFAMLLVISFFYYLFKERYYLAFALLSILFLVRPECFILFLLAVVYLVFHKKSIKSVAVCLLIFAAIVGSFLLYAWSSFGTIFPNTTFGKASFDTSFGEMIWQIRHIFETLAFSSAIELLLGIFFIIYLIRNRKWNKYWLMAFWIAGFIALYEVTDADLISRYLLIITPFITLLAVASLGIAKSKYILVSAIVFFVILIQSQFIFYQYVKPHADNFTYGVKNCYMEIGKWLDQSTPKDSRILVNDVGAIGYYSNRYIIDAAALINRDLEMNKRIMSVPSDERAVTANLLNFIKADYLVERDKDKDSRITQVSSFRLDFIFEKEFPSLGIADPNPTYYKVYKIQTLR